MSDQQSMEFSQDYEDIKAQPLANIKMPQRMFEKSNPNPSLFVNANINVLSANKTTSKLVVNDKFQQYLMEDINNSNAVIVSFLGRKRVGKSFLVDTLITAQTGRVSRSMSKNSSPIINSHPYRLTKGTENNLIFFDCNGEATNDIFLWTFFMSSVLVYNIEAHQHFNQEFHKIKEFLAYVQVHFDSDGEDISLPQLIIVIRDSKFKEIDKNLINQLQDFGLFQLPIQVFNMSYPGSKDVSAKEILDVPVKKLSSSYVEESIQLLKQLKLGKQKIIKGNYLSSKILSLAIEGAAVNFNKSGKISCTKVWNEVMENLSIGFHNYYLKCYEEELNLQFGNQKPFDKYTLCKKLSGIRRKLDKKIESFKNLNDDPIFQKYRNRLNQVIKSKQKLIKEVNKQKSKEANQRFCSTLFPQLNNENCELLLGRFMESELDDEKSTVLLQNFQNILEHRSRTQPKKQSGKQNSLELQIAGLQKQIQDLNNKLNQKQKVGGQAFDIGGKKSSIIQKKQELNTKTKKYHEQKAKAQNNNQQLNSQFKKLTEEKEKIIQKIKKNEEQLIAVRKQREEEMRTTTKKLQQQYQTEQEKLKKLEQLLRQARKQKVLAPPPPAKDKGCCCSVM